MGNGCGPDSAAVSVSGLEHGSAAFDPTRMSGEIDVHVYDVPLLVHRSTVVVMCARKLVSLELVYIAE